MAVIGKEEQKLNTLPTLVLNVQGVGTIQLMFGKFRHVEQMNLLLNLSVALNAVIRLENTAKLFFFYFCSYPKITVLMWIGVFVF